MKKGFLAGILFLIGTTLWAEIQIIPPTQKLSHSFAIIIDEASYSKTEKAVKAYRDAVQNDGLACYMLIEKTATPNEIKAEIKNLYNSEKFFEGVVFVGDIPIPMIRDAHHLSSAFKMDPERFNFTRSSIASDRFFDDFDLSFEFLKQDTTNQSLFFYSLTSDGTQKIEKEIYSARIKAPVDGDEKYDLLNDYLTRIAQQKKEIHEIKNLITFAGHGYHSESLASWEWDLCTMQQQFPQLYTPGHTIKNLNHASSDHMKKIILTEIQNSELDVALFHAHGADDTQYLNGYPLARNVDDNIRDIKLYVRSKLRQAKRWKRDPEEYKKGYMEKYGIPEDWFEGAFDDSMMVVDSIYGADLDIYASDLDGIKTQPKFVMFDECYNGQFTQTPYIAGKYIFSGGNTIVTVANSVNVKQDIWANEFIGLINKGVRIGQWHQTRNFIESHLIGDPTFHFGNLPEKLVKDLYANKEKTWRKYLRSDDPVYRNLGVRKLYEIKQDAFVPELVKVYENDPSGIVRLQALQCLATARTIEFENILNESAYDPAEMIRRVATIWMAKVGKEEYLPALANLMFNDHSDRVSRQAKESMGTINPDKAIEVMENELAKLPEIADKEALDAPTRSSFERNHNWLYNELIGVLQSDTTTLKQKKGAIRTFRNYSFPQGIDILLAIMNDKDSDLQLRINAAEALGWYTFSYQKEKIINACDMVIAEKDENKELIQEAIKTKKRIAVGSNNPIVP